MASSFLGLVARSIATSRLVASEGPRRSRPRHRKEVRNERIFRFVCFKSVARGPYAGARPLRGGSPVAVVEDLPARPVPARATLYARSRPEMAGEAGQRARDLHRSGTGEGRAHQGDVRPPFCCRSTDYLTIGARPTGCP